jgi:hypothetical protein
MADDDVYPRSQKVSIAVFQFFEGPMHHLNEIPELEHSEHLAVEFRNLVQMVHGALEELEDSY